MLRLAFKKVASARAPLTRSYSEGFEISKYLSRIEAITQRAPVSHKPRSQTNSAKKTVNAKGENRSNKTPRPNDQKFGSQRRASADGRAPQTRMKEGVNTAQSGTESASSVSRKPQTVPRRQTVARNSQAPGAQQPSDAGWTSLSSYASEPSKAAMPASRSNRRAPLRKPGSKVKFSKKTGSRSSNSSANQKKPKAPTNSREKIAYLTPKEGLDVVLRNEGTSYGGYIEPLDVSLLSLQPNFVESAATYNSRVRTLLNFVPAEVAQDQAAVQELVNKYVNGSYDLSILSSAKEGNLSYKGLASEVLANHSMSPSTRQYFAQVGAGKLTPKQIASR